MELILNNRYDAVFSNAPPTISINANIVVTAQHVVLRNIVD
jgi:hypothetical protein